MSTATQNRRLFFRLPLFVRVDLRVAGLRVPIPATVTDISGGGCALQTRTMLKPRTVVEFYLPRADAAPLRLAGSLVKVNYVPGDRTFRYAIAFEAMPDDVHDALLRYISHEQRRAIAAARGEELEATGAQGAPRLQEMRAGRRIEVNIPVRYSTPDAQGTFVGTAVDLSTGGARLITERILRQEWNVIVRFNLPHGATTELRLHAHPLPGVKSTRGRYLQSVAWTNPDPRDTEAIDRFVQHARLASLGRA
ncbi:MAG: PilZ domain-containing protein [bacterium]|nr:PilZ domain-containing protein [bacterium]